jgi:hypothetical protein
MVAYACNTNYSGVRDQEDHSSKPAWGNSSQDPILKKPITKRVGGVAQNVGPEFKHQYCKKKKLHVEDIGTLQAKERCLRNKLCKISVLDL